MQLVTVHESAIDCCDRCNRGRSLPEAAGYTLEDATGTRKFFCFLCVTALLKGCLPVAAPLSAAPAA